MYLTKYYFYEKKFYYLFPKMTQAYLEYLDKNKSDDKEWYLLRHEPNVEIKTADHIEGIPPKVKKLLYGIRDEPLKGDVMRLYKMCVHIISDGLKTDKMRIL